MLLSQVGRRDISRRTVLASPRHTIAHEVLHRSGDVILVDVVRVFALEAIDHRLAHLTAKVAILAEVLPDTWPTGITTKIDGRTIGPRHTHGTSLISGSLSRTTSDLTIESGSHIDVLREEGSALGISRTVVLVETEDARDADALHRNLLDLRDILLPLLGSWGASVRSVEDGAYLVAREDGVGLVLVDIEHAVLVVGTEEVGHQFHHLSYLLLQGEFLQGLFHLSLNLWVALNHRSVDYVASRSCKYWRIGQASTGQCQH